MFQFVPITCLGTVCLLGYALPSLSLSAFTASWQRTETDALVPASPRRQ